MRKGLKIAIIAASACLLIAAIFLVTGMNGNRKRQLTCGGVNVEFADDYSFVTTNDIVGYLNNEYGVYIGQLLDSVDLAKVERILDNKSAILKTEAYTTPDGMLNVKVFQREPVIRFQKGGNGFYADEKGFLFPLQSNYTSQVPIIDGNVPLTFESGYKGEPVSQKEKDWLGNIKLYAGVEKLVREHKPDLRQARWRPCDGPEAGKRAFHIRRTGQF